LALENYAIDMVQPLLADLMGALTRLAGSSSADGNTAGLALPPDFEALVKLRLWLQKLNEMRAYEELQQVKPEGRKWKSRCGRRGLLGVLLRFSCNASWPF